MGVIRCDIHGLSWITACCIHISDAAYDSNRFERANIELNGWGEPILVCDRCHETVLAQRRAHRAAGTRGWFYELDPRVCYPCSRHVDEWFAATGQVNLGSTIRAARAAARTFDDDIAKEPVPDPTRTTKCDVHSTRPTYPCCAHVSTAIDRGDFEHGHVEADGRGDPWIVCRRCRAQVRTQRTAARAADIKGWTLTLEPAAVERCDAHVAAWYAATGQVGLHTAIVAARAATGRFDDEHEDDDDDGP